MRQNKAEICRVQNILFTINKTKGTLVHEREQYLKYFEYEFFGRLEIMAVDLGSKLRLLL